MDLPIEVIQASAARYLIDEKQPDAANTLLACVVGMSLDDKVDAIDKHGREVLLYLLNAEFAGPTEIYKVLSDEQHPTTYAIRDALNASLPSGYVIHRMSARLELPEYSPNWRAELAELARSKETSNQGIEHGNVPAASKLWKDLRFRSQSEIRIAEALDAKGVLFLPNCLVRMNVDRNRETREVDFLVCSDGKWGILEVDGPQHGGRAAHDHDRDRLFKDYGIRVIERYTDTECYNNAPTVIMRFLELLRKNG